MNKNLYFILIFTFAFCSNTIAQDTMKTSVYFEIASFELDKAELNKLANFQKEYGTDEIITVLINGYTDDVGSIESNNVLSKNRAMEVKEQLGKLNFPISRNDRTEGFGPINLILEKSKIIEQRRLNRRVDILVIYKLPRVLDIEVKAKTPIEPEITTRKAEAVVKKLDNTMKVGDKVIMANLIFIGGRDLLRNEQNPDLDVLVKFMHDNPNHKIAILGHVCCVNAGLDGYNTETETRTLSVDRANKIYNLLVSRGIEKSRMSYRGLKGDYPTGYGENADRRVEIQIADIAE